MKDTILIPTDLTIESLMLVKHTVIRSSSNDLKIILLYCSELSESITDLLFYSPEKKLKSYISKDFVYAFNGLQSKYSQKVKWIDLKLFHAQSQTAFDCFVENENISEAFIPAKYKLKLLNNCIDPLPLIKKSNIRIQEVDWKEDLNISEKGTLTELFT